MYDSSRTDISLRDLLYIFFYRIHAFLIVFFATIFLVIAVTLLMESVYESSTTILVETRGASLEASASRDLALRQTVKEILNTEKQLILSNPVLARVLDRVKPRKAEEEKDESLIDHARKLAASICTIFIEEKERDPQKTAVEELRNNLIISPILDSSILEIRLRGDSPQRIKRELDVVTEEYISYHIAIYRSLWSEDFFQEQMEITRKHLTVLEDSLKRFQKRENTFIAENYDRVISEEVSQIYKDLLSLQEKINLQKARLQHIEGLLETDSEHVLLLFSNDMGNGIDLLLNKRLETEMERDELLSKFTPEYGRIGELELIIDSIDEKIEEKARKLYKLAQSELLLTEKEYGALRKVLDITEDRIQDFFGKQLFVAKLRQEIDDTRQIFSGLMIESQNARISSQIDQRVAALRVIDPAAVSDEPISPNVALNILLSPFLGILLGFFVVFIFELTDSSLKTEKEIEGRLKNKILVTVPFIGRGKLRVNENE